MHVHIQDLALSSPFATDQKTSEEIPSTSLSSTRSDNQITQSKEVWKDIPGVPNYQASDWGRIRSVRIRVLRPCRTRTQKNGISDQDGYYRVAIGNGFRKLVHRLVAAAFMEIPIPEGLVVHHKDNDKINNRLDNLEVVSYELNTRYVYADGRIGSHYKLNPLQRSELVRMYKTGQYQVKDLVKIFDVSSTNVRHLLKSAGLKPKFYRKVDLALREKIKVEYASRKVSMRQLAVEYGVSEGTIDNIIHNRPGGRRKSKPREANHPIEMTSGGE